MSMAVGKIISKTSGRIDSWIVDTHNIKDTICTYV